MKKITLIMALVAALTLVSCGKEDKKTEEKTTETNVEIKVEDNQEGTLEGEVELPEGEEIVVDPPAEKPEEKPLVTPEKPQQGGDKKPAELPKPSTPEKPVEPEKPAVPEKPATDTRSLNEIMSSILVGMGETPALGEIPLDPENFEFFTFAPYVEGAEGLVSEPMMGSFAHSVVLVRLPDGADVNGFANQVKANADPRKWICVEAEEVKVSTKGNLVLLVMSSSDNVGVISSNFLK